MKKLRLVKLTNWKSFLFEHYLVVTLCIFPKIYTSFEIYFFSPQTLTAVSSCFSSASPEGSQNGKYAPPGLAACLIQFGLFKRSVRESLSKITGPMEIIRL